MSNSLWQRLWKKWEECRLLPDIATQIQLDLSECLMPPPEAPPLSDVDRDTLHTWLSCGAPLDAVE